MKGLTKKILMAVASIALVSGTMFLDWRFKTAKSSWEDFRVEVINKGSDAIFSEKGSLFQASAGNQTPMVLSIGVNSILRLDKGSSAKLGIINDPEKPVEIRLMDATRGRIWINTLNSDAVTFMEMSEISVIADPGIFDMRYENGMLTLTAVRRSAEIDFLGHGLILPETRQIIVSKNKIKNSANTISKLRYSKLAKEFPYFAAPQPDAWTAQNSSEDTKFAAQYRDRVTREIRQKGSVQPLDEDAQSWNLRNVARSVAIGLTFDRSKRVEKQFEAALEYFDSGVYANQIGKNDVEEKKFTDFTAQIGGLLMEPANKGALNKVSSARFNRLAFAQPADQLFVAKTALRAAVRPSVLYSLHAAFNDVLDAAATGSDAESQQRVFTFLRRFGSQAQAQADALKNSASSDDILFVNVLLNDFLNRNPKYLREEFLRIPEIFEHAYVNLIAGDEAQEDSRQFFIVEKLKKIKALNDYMQNGAVLFQDARGSILLLVNQIEALKPTFPTTAVLSYFDDQLAQLGDLISFLRSADAAQVHGSFKQSFEEFQSSVDEMKAINEMLKNSTGGAQISPFRREELAGIVANDFAAVELTDIKILLPEVEGDSRVTIQSAMFEGKIIQGVYDTSRKVFGNLVFNSEAIPNAIRLENLKKFLRVKLGAESLPVGTTIESLTENQSQASTLEKVAKATLMTELSNAGIKVDEKYLGFENLNEGIIHVRMAQINEGADAKVFSFDFDQTENEVKNLLIQTVSGSLPVNGTFSVRELPVKIEQIFARAAFEKQRNEELQRNLGTTTM